ncbi:P-loop containing nucleoside triphosphate hydrolase protein [Coniophora puteana RWD-64-598 SS2]|uniref:Structural maintenance of chromosomes protein 5 n=1 Tax=Coniophora puteana (strain RWD-64-598) TaxID=741705 RepID=A0A5M3MC95_CONPW|nr:P-loop containing nucleoside triphosphate hydrolase protein [Coniophora puteana RWD-64-598 SS2]EIW76265.1 P-loop containing nucleoside triphosphate hydrolase protein [Coniophora puteana RWD-64-598 SS2]
MTRKTRASGANDPESLKENVGLAAVKVKDEKTKVKKEKSRRNVDEEEPEDSHVNSQANGVDAEEGDEDEEGGEEDGEGSLRRKRARVNEDGESRAHSMDRTQERIRVQTLPRDEDGYIPGSIVRIQLQNFLTYDWTEFRPGPYLNMILGPNGTGKSSIACAICLGLNWPASTMGRATDVKSFVKHGATEGYIEIELKGAKKQRNVIIRRHLSADKKSSSFTLNGKSSSGKEVTAKVAQLNVQVGNLCSFLPQDKVSEFAHMSPQQLLRETQRAAGDSRLTNWHDTLINSGKEHKQLQEKMTDEQNTLKVMQDRNNQLEREVQRYQERMRIEKEINMLNILIPVNEYHEARAVYMTAKEKQRKLHVKVKKLKEKNAPAHALLEQLGVQYKDAEKAREKKKNATKAKFTEMKGKWAHMDKLENEADDLQNKMDSLKKQEKERLRKIKELQSQSTRWQAELDNPPEFEDTNAIMEQQREISAKNTEVKKRLDNLQDRQKVNVDESEKHRSIIGRAQDEFKKLEDERHRKLQRLGQWDKDHADAVIWLRNNHEKFKMEVFEPPMISCSVPDGRYINAVEACFSANQLKTFVCQCEEDYQTLNHYLNDSSEAGLRPNARINVWFRPKRNLVPPPLTPEELAEFGFGDYALNYIECPDGLLWFFKREMDLHRTAIGLNGSKIDTGRVMEAVSRFGPNGEGGGANFIAGNVMNRVQRSRYGRRLPQNQTRDIRQARNLVNSSIDPEVKRKLEQDIQQAERALTVLEQESATLTAEEREIRGDANKFRKDWEDLEARRRKVQETKKHLATLEAKIDQNRNKIANLENAPSVEDERNRLKQKLIDVSKKRVKLVKEYSTLIRGVIADQTAATRCGIEFLQIGANRNALDAMCQQKAEHYQRALAEFEEADKAYNRAKTDAKNKRDVSLQLVRDMDQEFQDEFERMEHDGSVHARTVNELRAELETQEANLEMIMQTNPGVVEQYERRKQEIENMTKMLESHEKAAQRLEREIKTARDKWEPALEELVASIGKKFSAAFDRIGCAGEIRINRHEDYDKWAIDILVKFRDKEKLQLLTGQRQSGGERSLTTILYLMSLTEEARTPFSLVDEINQGMDQRAERAVHNSMVEVTCKEDSGQYFLITPKLLADLNYHERMKILCVNNGEWLPDENAHKVGNLMGVIDNVVKLRDRSTRAT